MSRTCCFWPHISSAGSAAGSVKSSITFLRSSLWCAACFVQIQVLLQKKAVNISHPMQIWALSTMSQRDRKTLFFCTNTSASSHSFKGLETLHMLRECQNSHASTQPVPQGALSHSRAAPHRIEPAWRSEPARSSPAARSGRAPVSHCLRNTALRSQNPAGSIESDRDRRTSLDFTARSSPSGSRHLVKS